MLLFVIGCLGLDPNAKIVRAGSAETDSAPDTAGEGTDSGAADSGADTDTSVSIPDGLQVCYPGAADDYSACLPLVDWSEAWGDDYAYPAPYEDSAQYIAPVRFVDLSTTDPSESVDPNFIQSELMSASKGRYGLFQVHAAESLQILRDASGGALTVTSAYRDPVYNASVGGVSSSRHIYGDGVDLVSDVWSLDQLAEGCAGAGAAYTQLYTDHVHCDWRDDPLDPAFYDVPPEDTGATARVPRPAVDARISIESGQLRAPATGFDEGEPLRTWRAYDAAGGLVGEATGASFSPPAGTARVVVEVGGVLERAVDFPSPALRRASEQPVTEGRGRP